MTFRMLPDLRDERAHPFPPAREKSKLPGVGKHEPPEAPDHLRGAGQHLGGIERASEQSPRADVGAEARHLLEQVDRLSSPAAAAPGTDDLLDDGTAALE